jgi:molybdenum cofactor biosynthesis enzyme
MEPSAHKTNIFSAIRPGVKNNTFIKGNIINITEIQQIQNVLNTQQSINKAIHPAAMVQNEQPTYY